MTSLGVEDREEKTSNSLGEVVLEQPCEAPPSIRHLVSALVEAALHHEEPARFLRIQNIASAVLWQAAEARN